MGRNAYLFGSHVILKLLYCNKYALLLRQKSSGQKIYLLWTFIHTTILLLISCLKIKGQEQQRSYSSTYKQ
ncbi:hypothetical protein Hanom_Chr15g01354411 [Helianthus anomalus]